METRAISFLEKMDVNYKILNYKHNIKGAKYAADSLGVDIKQMIKSLVVKDNNSCFYFCLMPGHLEISTKKVAKLLNVKSIMMANQQEAERVTGYFVGGISPFGSKSSLKVIIDSTLELYDQIYINGGSRGVILKMKFSDIKKILDPLLEDIAIE
jgi:Cys-tRNA(Pro)/Cys-tRNA(Cys) deacylase